MSYLNFIRRYSEQILLAMTERNKSGQGFVCPVCGSGTSEGETGISPVKGKPGIFQCDNPGCRFKKGDVLKIIELAYHLQGGDSVKKAGELIGMDFKKEYQAERKRVFQERREPYKKMLALINQCEAMQERAAEQGQPDPARTDPEYQGIIDGLVNENCHSLALLLEHYHFTGAKALIKGLFT